MSGTSNGAVGWQKSDDSVPKECVEVLIGRSAVRVRDSKDRDGPELMFTHREWNAFLAGVRRGQFDLPSEAVD